MRNGAKRSKGAANEVAGKVEKAAGPLVGSEFMEAGGRARELEGRAEQDAAKPRARIKGEAGRRRAR